MLTLWKPAALFAGLILCAAQSQARDIDLRNAVIVTYPGPLPEAEKTAAIVLREELEKRSGIRLPTSTTWPSDRPVIAITSRRELPAWSHKPPAFDLRPEGYRLITANSTVWVLGADARGSLFGVGNLLRRIDAGRNQLSVAGPLDITTAPTYAIRGHQLGYRTQANSYDAWSIAQFEQYIRELTYFGVNSIESIPFHDDRPTPVMKVPRRDMNRALGEISHRYGLDYWAWIPAEFDLKDTALRTSTLERCAEFFRDTPTLTGVFFPGGDPGQNPPELVLPFLEDMAKSMRASHPRARIWISLQWFTPAQVDSVYAYIEKQKPAWFAGLVAGPSSPPIPETRRRLPKQYQLRSYPDLTHNKLSQYQVPSWDQAFALTLGREAINPRPAEYALIHNRTAPYTDGFISYSDGAHDDVNKTIWSALSWDPTLAVRDVLIDYAHVYFNTTVASDAADGILALERNWRGPLITNGAVDGTLLQWQQLEQRAPQLANNWRWQMCLLRANYDAYIRHRLINETQLELEANAAIEAIAPTNPDRAMDQAMSILNRAVSQPVSPNLRSRIVELCEQLFKSIGLQTSVEKYFASGEERGAVLDFVDYPLNNRWWLEDQFKKLRSDSDKSKKLLAIARWEHPDPGSFYDDIGNIANSPHVVRNEAETAPESARQPEPTFWWWDQGNSRARLSAQTTMWPVAVVYDGLDPAAQYTVRSSGYGQALLRVNGERVQPSLDGRQMDEFKEFPVPSKYLKDRKLTLTWDRPTDEGQLNWRQHSRLAEVWLLKKE